MDFMMTFSWVGIMLLIGMLLRALIKPLGNILVPACVTGGIIGFILMNTGILTKLGANPAMCNTLVDIFFTLSFISIGLTATPKEEGVDSTKETLKGTIGLGCIWDLLYGLQPLIEFGSLLLVGSFFAMAPEYGLLIPFAFCQGPGQSQNFGGQIEAAGWADAQQVAITFAVFGFLFAFFVGVPLAKYGMKKGLSSFPREISSAIKKGVYEPEEQTQVAGMMTTYNGNIDVLAFNAALVGLCYVITIPICNFLMSVPISVVQSIGSMKFFVGLFVAYGVRWIIGKLGIAKYHDSVLQARITGFTTDFLIAGAFMAVQLSVVGKWMIPISLTALITGIVTLVVCVFFCQRLGGAFDFERLLGMWGCATGTCPSGIALIRIVDPELRTTAATEMGSMNAMMIPYTILAPFCIEFCKGTMSFQTLVIWYIIGIVAAFAIILFTKNFKKKKSFNLLKGEKYIHIGDSPNK